MKTWRDKFDNNWTNDMKEPSPAEAEILDVVPGDAEADIVGRVRGAVIADSICASQYRDWPFTFVC